MITENLSTLKIHKLSQEQYDREKAAGNLDPNAFYLTPDSSNVTFVSTLDENYNTIIPQAGEQYIIKFENLPRVDNEGNKTISDETVYIAKIGDGVTTLAELPQVSYAAPGNGRGSIVQFIDEEAYGFEQDGVEYNPRPIADGYGSAALGRYTEVYASNSMAVNYGNEISPEGTRSFACVSGNTINGKQSFAAGLRNTSNANDVMLIGSNNVGNAGYNILVGRGLQSSTGAQVAIGAFNTEDENASLVIGNGTSKEERNNALAIKKDGTIDILGSNFSAGVLAALTKTPFIGVKAPAGTIITCASGGTVTEYEAVDGITTLNVPYGQYTVSATFDGVKYERTVTVNGIELPTLYFDAPAINFSETSFESIIMACECNQVPDTWNYNDEIAITYENQEYKLAIIGKGVDTIAATGELAPLTLQFKNVIGTARMNSTDFGNVETDNWGDSYLRTSYMPLVLSRLPEIVRNAIVPVTKNTLVDWEGTILTTEEYLFVPSEDELSENFYPTLAVNTDRIKTDINGTTTAWWLRSVYDTAKGDKYKNKFDLINATGNITTGSSLNSPKGVAPAFCLGSTYVINDNPVTEVYVTKEEFEQLKTDLDITEYEGNIDRKAVAYANEAHFASTAGDAMTAEEDGRGRNIIETYATKTELNTKASVATYTATIPTTNWSNDIPYTTNVAVTGITSTGAVDADINLSSVTDVNTIKQIIKEWSKIDRITTNNNSITIYCYSEIPSVEIPIQLKVVQ